MKPLIFALVVTMVVMVSENCPDGCTCRMYPGDHTTLDYFYLNTLCTGFFNASDLEDTTEVLEIHNASEPVFRRILKDLSDDQRNFSKLIFQNIDLPSPNNLTISFDDVQTLTITNSNLEDLPGFNSSQLVTLNLPSNKIQFLDDNHFRTLTSLENLNLSANLIKTINASAFSGLKTLKSLELSCNKLSELQDNTFQPLVNLQNLNLSNNELEVLNESYFGGLLCLQQLDVSWNKLRKVAPGSLQLPSLARLLLAGNSKLGNSRELLVGTGRRLQTVDASRTGLQQVPSALTHSIRTLKLSGNLIQTINCGDMDLYPLVQLLDFSSNKLAVIEEDAMGRLESLTVLYLTDNQLSSIPHSLPEKLRVLHLENNKIATIESKDLQSLTQLEVLLLMNNRIKEIKDCAFNQLASLSTLDLSYNPIEKLPMGSLSGPVQLRVLRLSGLNVISPAKESEFPLSYPEKLITLDLSNSPGLARQMLADTAVLVATRELQELNLSAADLSYIRYDLLHFLPQLRAFHLEGNPLNCTNLQWLAEWFRKQDSPQTRTITCASPPELSGTLLVDLQSVEVETSTDSSTSTRATTKSNNATLDSSQKPTTVLTKTINYTTNNNYSTKPITNNSIITDYIISKFVLKPINILSSSKENEVVNEKPTAAMTSRLSPLTSQVIVDGNVSSAETSMYSGKSSQNVLLHPGMLIMTICVLVGAALLVVFTTSRMSFGRDRRRSSSSTEDIEVSSLPSVTELW